MKKRLHIFIKIKSEKRSPNNNSKKKKKILSYSKKIIWQFS